MVVVYCKTLWKLYNRATFTNAFKRLSKSKANHGAAIGGLVLRVRLCLSGAPLSL